MLQWPCCQAPGCSSSQTTSSQQLWAPVEVLFLCSVLGRTAPLPDSCPLRTSCSQASYLFSRPNVLLSSGGSAQAGPGFCPAGPVAGPCKKTQFNCLMLQQHPVRRGMVDQIGCSRLDCISSQQWHCRQGGLAHG